MSKKSDSQHLKVIESEVLRDKNGRLVKGSRGINPKGAGGKTKFARYREQLLKEAAPEIIQKCIEMAKDGDSVAMRLCMERLFPTARALFPHTDPELKEQLKTADGILAASQEGELTSDHAASFIDNLKRTEELRLLQEAKGAVAVIEVATSPVDGRSDHVSIRLADED